MKRLVLGMIMSLMLSLCGIITFSGSAQCAGNFDCEHENMGLLCRTNAHIPGPIVQKIEKTGYIVQHEYITSNGLKAICYVYHTFYDVQMRCSGCGELFWTTDEDIVHSACGQ